MFGLRFAGGIKSAMAELRRTGELPPGIAEMAGSGAEREAVQFLVALAADIAGARTSLRALAEGREAAVANGGLFGDELHALADRERRVRAGVERLAAGDTSLKLEGRGAQDGLTRAIDSVADTLRNAAEQADALALGDYRAEFKPRGAGDRLGHSLSELTRTLRVLAEAAAKIATGNTTEKVGVKGPNDLLGRSVNHVVDTLRDAAEQADAIAKGDYRADVKPRGPDDRLGSALAEMTITLRGVTDICRSVSTGNTRRLLASKGKNDALAASFNRLVRSLRDAAAQAERVAEGDFSAEIEGRNAQDRLGIALFRMTKALRDAQRERERALYLADGLAEIASSLRIEKSGATMANELVALLARSVNAQVGALYSAGPDGAMRLTGSFAFARRKRHDAVVEEGAGLLAQALLEKQMIVVERAPPGYLTVSSGLGEAEATTVLVLPLVYAGEVVGAIELGSFDRFTEQRVELLRQAAEPIAIALNTLRSRTRLEDLLARTQTQAEELQTQQEELRSANEELEANAERIRASEEELRQQTEELQATNEELEEKTALLERRGADLEALRAGLEDKAASLEEAGRYKSQFLANMSHELRTPLNSLLLLAHDLVENRPGNLDGEQLESLAVIQRGGKELLALINDVLDLAKVEAGKLDMAVEQVDVEALLERVRTQLLPMARERQIRLEVSLAAGAPRAVETDEHRLVQILKNLISNGIKFTEEGSVKVEASATTHAGRPALRISVRDTGIGIPSEHQSRVWEAFQQVDGSTSRKYGGTGLGLTISRELAARLGGTLSLKSDPAHGSTFALTIPLTVPEAPVAGAPGAVEAAPRPSPRPSAGVAPGAARAPTARSLLIIDDDPTFARTVCRLAERRGFATTHVSTAEEGLESTRQRPPTAIILDLGLPDMNGRELLRLLKADASTRDIPIYVVSAADPDATLLAEGALGQLQKSGDPSQLNPVFEQLEAVLGLRPRRVLLVEDDLATTNVLRKTIERRGIEIVTARDGASALAELAHPEGIGCIVLDLGLPDIRGEQLLREVRATLGAAMPPVVVHTGRALAKEEVYALEAISESIVIKGAASSDRLLDEITLFLHAVGEAADTRNGPSVSINPELGLGGKKVLLVDDDVRNTFALAKVLRAKDVEVFMADNGKLALERLAEHPDIDLVLMDIMMPIMDGYEAIRRIREQPAYARLPVIAVTAKAMSDDRAKVLAAGANDYLPKPIDVPRLVSLMRVWLAQVS
jgi:signal transduction histidine kinase/CheY-like chemotaxis protein/flagellar hook-basal body complex protein FliE